MAFRGVTPSTPSQQTLTTCKTKDLESKLNLLRMRIKNDVSHR